MQSYIKKMIRTIPNWPKEGIMFRDITTLLSDPKGLQYTINLLFDRYKDEKIDIICGIEARGFILGAALAYKMNLGFVPLRKKGKLPGKTVSVSYDLEYGSDTLEIHADAFNKGTRVLLVDDLLATGGTALGGQKLVEKIGGDIVEACFIVDLPDLGGGEKLTKSGLKWHALIDFDGE